jgi:hypothetical protein
VYSKSAAIAGLSVGLTLVFKVISGEYFGSSEFGVIT